MPARVVYIFFFLTDLAGINIDIDCEDVNIVVAQYDTFLYRLLDKHAPFMTCSVDKPLGEWMTIVLFWN